MAKMLRIVRIIGSPFTPSLEVVDGFVMKLHVPYSNSTVSIKIDPNINHYEDQPKESDSRITVGQVAVHRDTDDTQNLVFDFQKNNIQKVKIMDKTFEIKLLNIGKKRLEDQDFPEFEFLVTEI